MGNGAMPRARSRRGDLVLVCAVAVVWLLPWLLLTGASAVSGVHPDVSPLGYVNPLRLVSLYRADGNSVVWWHLVGAGEPAHVWLFFAFIIAALVGMLVALAAGLLVWAAGSPGWARRCCSRPGARSAPRAGRRGATSDRCGSAVVPPAR